MAVTKKTTTVAKKTTTAAKKTTTAAKKTSTSSSSSLTVSGNKKLSTFQRDFNKAFPYLCILFYNRNGVELKGDRTFASIAGSAPGGSISVAPNKRIGNLEADFLKNFNIKVQIFWTSRNSGRVLTSHTDDMTLAKLNSLCEKDGEIKGVWK